MGCVLRNNRGVSLIELMLALVLLAIVSLAMMQTALLGMTTNVQNLTRDEAVQIADMRMNQLRGLPFTQTLTHADLAPAVTTEAAVTRNVRGFKVTYTPKRTITDINANSKQITMTITWNFKGKSYMHEVTTIMRSSQ